MTDIIGEALQPMEYGEPVGPRKRGRPPTGTPNKGRLNATIDRELYDLLREEAESETGGNVSRLIEQILDKRYERN